MRASRTDLMELLRCSLDNPLDNPFADLVAAIAPKEKIFIKELVEELAELFPMFTRSQIDELCQRLRPTSRKKLLQARLHPCRPERLSLSQPVGFRQLSELRRHYATKSGSSKRPRGQLRLKRGKLATLLGYSQHSICNGYVDLFSSIKRESAGKGHQKPEKKPIQDESKGRNNGATGSGVNGTNQVSIGFASNLVGREAVSSKSLRLVQILDETLFPPSRAPNRVLPEGIVLSVGSKR